MTPSWQLPLTQPSQRWQTKSREPILDAEAAVRVRCGPVQCAILGDNIVRRATAGRLRPVTSASLHESITPDRQPLSANEPATQNVARRIQYGDGPFLSR